jgi:hypothetical protein
MIAAVRASVFILGGMTKCTMVVAANSSNDQLLPRSAKPTRLLYR